MRNTIRHRLRAELEFAPHSYNKWLRGNMGLARVKTDAEAAKVIEGLLAMKRRQRRRERA